MSGLGYYNPFPVRLGGGDTPLEQEHKIILNSLEPGFGSEEDTESYWESYVEASVVALIWAINERLKSQAIPDTMIEALPRWEEATSIRVRNNASDDSRRARLAAKFRGTANNALVDIEDVARKVLVARFDGIELAAPAEHLVYWPGVNPGPPGLEWSTNRCLVNVKVNKSGLTDGEFIDLVGDLIEHLFQAIPVWMSANVSVDGTWIVGQGVLNQTVLKSPSVPQWAPTEISDLALWYRADIMAALSGGDLSTISDRSGNANDGTGGGGGGLPTYELFGLGGKESILFDAAVDNITAVDNNTIEVADGSFLIMMACRIITGSTAQCLIGKGSHASADNIRCTLDASDFLQVRWGSDAQVYTAGTVAVPVGVDTIVGWGIDYPSSEVIYVVGDVIERISVSPSGTGSNALPLTIAEDTSGSLPSDFRLAEVVFYNRNTSAVPDADVVRVIQYMKARYGV